MMKDFLPLKKMRLWLILIGVGICALPRLQASTLVDDAGRALNTRIAYLNVVSLVPSATEIIVAIGAGDAITGITYHSTSLAGMAEKHLVGGFFSPSLNRIEALGPDLVIVSPIHKDIISHFDSRIPLLTLSPQTLKDAFRHMLLLGEVFHRKVEAKRLVDKNKGQLALIAEKTSRIPLEKKKRVMRLMGRDAVMTPGRDSFQNEMIRAAGGIPPDFGKSGQIVHVTREEWVDFNPQVLYGCGEDLKSDSPLFARPGWGDVTAVKNKVIITFPCNLTCRAGVHMGDFVSWLSARIYPEEFSDGHQEVLPRKMLRDRPLALPFDYVRKAMICTSTIYDFEHKSLVVEFNRPMGIVSTLDGQRDGVLTVGNHYTPPPCWGMTHSCSVEDLKQSVCSVLKKKPDTAAFLFTGANMDNLAVRTESFRDMKVTGLVTAGVRGNAVRMGRDTGNYYEPGTINMIFLTNMTLSKRAMTRAIISATEGKSAALQDLDIRSSYLPLDAAATGTGTDNIIVVQGHGPPVDNAGGHSKMGELIARAAYRGVREAILRQNGISGGRDVFARLKERKLTVRSLVTGAACECRGGVSALASALEELLLSPEYSGFVETALSLSDAWERHTVGDLTLFTSWCESVAGALAGMPVTIGEKIERPDIPKPLALALNALITGLQASHGQGEGAE